MSVAAALLSLDEAMAAVLARCRPLPAEDVLVAQAAGRFLAETVRAPVDLPPFRRPRWTASLCAPPIRRQHCRSPAGSQPVGQLTGRSLRVR